ncbi:GAF domain-containing protein [Streptomyces lydicus]|uniref:GAF domain-containing protein n=1 Tax=Streptomyces lydicus TaxID=47763 RepID=UPI0037ACF17C
MSGWPCWKRPPRGSARLWKSSGRRRNCPSAPYAQCLASGKPLLIPVLDQAASRLAQEPERAAKMLGAGAHSVMTVPLRARETTLGLTTPVATPASTTPRSPCSTPCCCGTPYRRVALWRPRTAICPPAPVRAWAATGSTSSSSPVPASA